MLEIIPGCRQDHLGRTYQLTRDERGNLGQVFVELPPLSAKLSAGLEPVVVASQGNPGTTYVSMKCYQGSSA